MMKRTLQHYRRNIANTASQQNLSTKQMTSIGDARTPSSGTGQNTSNTTDRQTNRQTDGQTPTLTNTSTTPRNTPDRATYSVSQKNPPCGFLIFFPNGWEFLINFLHTYYMIISTLEYKFLFKYLQL